MSLLRLPQFLYTGVKKFGITGFNSAKAAWEPHVREATERDLSNTHCLVTGSNQGLGYQIALELACRNATVAMVCRSKERGAEALAKIQSETGNPNLSLFVCDVSSLKSIRALVDEYSSTGRPLDILINNAGVLLEHNGEKSEDGFETNFATNTLGTFALTTLFIPLLRKSSKESDKNRVITVSSGGMLNSHLEIDDLELKRARTFDATTQYARDKRRQVAMTEHWARSHPDLAFYTVHPGWTTTEGVKSSIPSFYATFEKEFRPLPAGADGIVYLACAASTDLVNGGFYLDRTVQKKHLAFSAGTKYSEADAQRLCVKLKELAKL